MFTESYRRYLKSPKWAIKRQQTFSYHGRRCKACGKTRGILQVHHLDYGRLGNENPATDLIPLCLGCHKAVTRLYRRNRGMGIRSVTMRFIDFKKRAIREARRTPQS